MTDDVDGGEVDGDDHDYDYDHDDDVDDDDLDDCNEFLLVYIVCVWLLVVFLRF